MLRPKTLQNDEKVGLKPKPDPPLVVGRLQGEVKKSELRSQPFYEQANVLFFVPLTRVLHCNLDFQITDCQNVNFRIANCQNVTFQNANCQNVNFQIANCQNVDLQIANHHNVYIQIANCQNVNFQIADHQSCMYFVQLKHKK
jgi:uncharacterized protein YjbI with pentapeptide repeats